MSDLPHRLGETPARASADSPPLELRSAETARLRQLLGEALAPATRAAYASDLRCFWSWAELASNHPPHHYPVPVDLILRYILHEADGMPPLIAHRLRVAGVRRRSGSSAPSTLARRIYALATVHRLLEIEPNPANDPRVRQLLRAARRRASRAGYRPAKPRAVTSPVLEAMLSTCGSDLAGRRDRALLLFGWASGGRRRSEIARARMEDLESVPHGYLLRLGLSKTDQEGADDRPRPVLGRAAIALDAWLGAAGLSSGPLFRAVDRWGNLGAALSPRAVAEIVRRRAAAAGYPADLFSGHSLRSGFITEAGRRGIALTAAMELSGHTSWRVAAGYHQAGTVLDNPAAHLAD